MTVPMLSFYPVCAPCLQSKWPRLIPEVWKDYSQCEEQNQDLLNRQLDILQLERERKGQFSISVNDQWRICFRFIDDDAYDVELTDYH